jgi:very-short-patch-repair endonuclease
MPKLRLSGEAAVEQILKMYGVQFVREHRFHPTRKWRFDFAVLPIEKKIAVEVEGGVWSGGRHTRGSGYIGDMEKYNEAALMGWKVLRYPASQITTRVVADLERLNGS